MSSVSPEKQLGGADKSAKVSKNMLKHANEAGVRLWKNLDEAPETAGPSSSLMWSASEMDWMIHPTKLVRRSNNPLQSQGGQPEGPRGARRGLNFSLDDLHE